MVLVALAVILLINRDKLGLHYREWQLQRSIKKMGSEQIRNLICADGLDGFLDLDRLLLTSKEIILISYRPYSGNIYCAERISEWTQVLGQRSFKFKNPLFDLENQLTALRHITGKVPARPSTVPVIIAVGFAQTVKVTGVVEIGVQLLATSNLYWLLCIVATSVVLIVSFLLLTSS